MRNLRFAIMILLGIALAWVMIERDRRSTVLLEQPLLQSATPGGTRVPTPVTSQSAATRISRLQSVAVRGVVVGHDDGALIINCGSGKAGALAMVKNGQLIEVDWEPGQKASGVIRLVGHPTLEAGRTVQVVAADLGQGTLSAAVDLVPDASSDWKRLPRSNATPAVK
jgi:hypothetical protein